MNGLELLGHLGDEIQRIPVIIITGRGSDERVVQAIEAGAFWYIEKPLKPPVLRALLDRALGRVRDQKAVAALTRELRDAGKLGVLVGSSREMQDVMQQVEVAAPSTASVLITGETGSGKEMVARSIHMLSPRADRPFIAINCSAIPESLMESEIFGHEKGAFTGAAERRIGCFELADGGTLLLDEIGEMPAADAGQAVARARRPQSAAAGQQSGNARGRPRARRHEQKSRAGCRRRTLAPGSLFPAERVPHPPAAACASTKRICRCWSNGCWRKSPRSTEKSFRRRRGRDGNVQVVSLARKRARAAQRAGTLRDRLRPRNTSRGSICRRISDALPRRWLPASAGCVFRSAPPWMPWSAN